MSELQPEHSPFSLNLVLQGLSNLVVSKLLFLATVSVPYFVKLFDILSI